MSLEVAVFTAIVVFLLVALATFLIGMELRR